MCSSGVLCVKCVPYYRDDPSSTDSSVHNWLVVQLQELSSEFCLCSV